MKETRFKDTEIGRIPEDWEVKIIKTIAEVHGRIGFRGYTVNDLVSEGFGALVIGGKHISKNRLDLSSPDYLSWSKYYESPEIMVKEGNIVMAQRGTLGRVAYINRNIGPATINPSLVLLNNIKCNACYLFQVLSGSRCSERILSMSSQTSIPMISQNQIENFSIILPTKQEQSRIASALTSIDNLIASLDKLIEKKKNIKQGTMQQLLTGKKRLNGFCGDWKTLRLGNCASIKARIGWQGLTTNEYLPHGDYYLISGSDFQNGRVLWDSCYFVSEDRFSQDKNIQIQDKDVLVSKDGTIGKVAYLDDIPGKGTLNSGVFVIRSKTPELTQDYLALVFRSMFFDEFIDKIVAGSTIVHLYQKDIVNFSFLVPPTIAEQLALSKLITTMESEILSLEEKRDKYLCIKQGMMQQLLSGSIRLININYEA